MTQNDPQPTAADAQEKTVRDHVTTLHLIEEQLAEVDNWMWRHLADVRDEQAAAVSPSADRADLRQRIAEVVDAVFEQWKTGLGEQRPQDAVTDAVLAAFQQYLNIGDAEAWCKTCCRVWDGPRHRCESDAEQRLASVRDLAARWQASVRPDEPHPAARALLGLLDEPAAVPPAPDQRAAVLHEAADNLAQMRIGAEDPNPDEHVRGYNNALDHAEAELRRLAGEAQQDEARCVCGEPTAPGTVHRTDGPCYVREAQQDPAQNGEALPSSTAPLAAGLPLVKGNCPACHSASLFLGNGGHVTCSRIDCPEPDAATTVLEDPAAVAQPGQPETDEETRRG